MLATNDPNGNAAFLQLLDELAEHCPDDPAFGDPSLWPAWTDEVMVSDGAPLDESEFVPEPEDWAEYELYLERLETEERFGINARFAP
jgi:hypothetical protein